MTATASATITGIWGARGSGKSTLALALVRAEPRVVVFDPLDEYGAAGFQTVTARIDLWRAIKRRWVAGRWRIAYVPTGDAAAELDALAAGLLAVQQPFKDGRDARAMVLLVEEASLSVPVTAPPAGRQSFRRLVNVGRHWGVSIIATSQRMAQVHNDLRGNTSADYFLRLRAAVDYQAAAALIGRSNAERLSQIGEHRYLKFAAGVASEGSTRAPV